MPVLTTAQQATFEAKLTEKLKHDLRDVKSQIKTIAYSYNAGTATYTITITIGT